MLIPEVPVYALDDRADGSRRVIVGVADALSMDESGTPRHVIDWKTDVEPTAAVLTAYRAQMSAYLQATGLATGLLVFVTSGTVLSITSSQSLAL